MVPTKSTQTLESTWGKKWKSIHDAHKDNVQLDIDKLRASLMMGRVALVCRVPFQSHKLPLSLQEQGFFAPLEWARDPVHIYLLYKDPETDEITATTAYDTDRDPPRLIKGARGDHLHDRDLKAALDSHERLMYKTEHTLLPESFPSDKLIEETKKGRRLVLTQYQANTLPEYVQEEYDCQTAVKTLLNLSLLDKTGSVQIINIPLPTSFKGVAWNKKMRSSKSASHIPHKKALVIQHHDLVPLGNFAPVLKKLGFEIEIYKPYKAQEAEAKEAPKVASSARYPKINLKEVIATDPDLLIILGGTQAAYETDKYPYLLEEERIVRERVEHDLPTLGTCLGAQVIAKAMGAGAFKGHMLEAGLIDITPSTKSMHPVSKLINAEFPLPNLHRDTFNLPPDAELLASSDEYRNHIFTIGDNTLAIQSHPEVNASTFCQWLDLLDIPERQREKLQEEAKKIDKPSSQALIQKVWHKWFKSIMPVRGLWQEERVKISSEYP